MQLLCCKQQQSSLRIRPRSKNTDPQSVRDVSLNVATPLMVRGRNGRHSDGGYRSRHTDDDLSGDRGRVFVGGCLCWWGGDVGGSVALLRSDHLRLTCTPTTSSNLEGAPTFLSHLCCVPMILGFVIQPVCLSVCDEKVSDSSVVNSLLSSSPSS